MNVNIHTIEISIAIEGNGRKVIIAERCIPHYCPRPKITAVVTI